MIDKEKIPLWRDSRFLKILLQVFVVLILGLVILTLSNNLINNFQRLGLNFGLFFLVDSDRTASFSISDSLIPYSSTDSYGRAVLVGLLNSLRVMIIGIVLAFIVGITVGLGRLSDNWLVRKIASIYVEILRNTPLLLQLFFWYFAVFLKFPKIYDPGSFWGLIFFSNQGIYLPRPLGNLQTFLVLGLIVFSVLLVGLVWRKQNQMIVQSKKKERTYQGLLLGISIFVLLSFIFGIDWQLPQYNSDINLIQGGLNLSPEFTTLLLGLTIYTAAFIAEIVRAGVQSVSKGQWEAATALGLNPGLVMRLVIFPQALRVMIPPLTSEFLNLAKNSSLAVAIGYNDIYAVANTVSNQTGRAVEMLLVVMITYLVFNLIISTMMNQFNAIVQLKER
ncbi:amino acid ABC transporter permease [cyanobacterium endosymbiont of Rhopalodia gibberula]|uniref:amino acid ABC transporter permease n=1 Tax=cyanobacterium endosymbiont of Rhopalodia gibberula TaxID=1763363 RepID=UPI000DC72695|nr:ABC transporter permease subunit [cyanobacterium endosymbiont of Rhopalodia gibberula]BBA78892.1 amino acid ABC transporter permease [cyanobacterium endosymbiont of Rhopalodia gibberula]